MRMIVQAATANAVFGIDYANLGIATGGAFPVHLLDESRSEDFLTPTVIVEWDATDNTMIYGSVSRGAKAGGFDARGNLAGNFEFEDEEVTAWEVGSKSRLADGRLEVNTAIFYSDYQDLQVSQFDGTVGFLDREQEIRISDFGFNNQSRERQRPNTSHEPRKGV